MKMRIVGIFSAAVLLCLPTSGRADPVAITAGQWTNAFFLDGGGISLVSSQFDVEAALGCTAAFCGSPRFAPGSVVDFSSTASAGPSIFGTGTVNGVTYSRFGPQGSVDLLSFGGTTLTFHVAPMTIPDAAPVGTRVSFALPFTMTGFLNLVPTTQFDPTPIGDPVFSNQVTGTGTLNVSLFSGQIGSDTLWGLTHPANFVFASSVAPTPEPASVLLLGAGLVGIARRYRRQ